MTQGQAVFVAFWVIRCFLLSFFLLPVLPVLWPHEQCPSSLPPSEWDSSPQQMQGFLPDPLQILRKLFLRSVF